MRDEALYRYIPARPPRAVHDLETRYRRTSAGPPAPEERWWNWAVANSESPTAPFGTVEVSLADNGATASLAYVFARVTWGRGFAYEACRAALAHVRERAGTRTVDAHIDTRNERSVRLARRLGFIEVATIRSADYFKGSTSDEYHYRLSLAPVEEHDGQA